MYIACLKDGVAVATSICDNLEESRAALSMYDEVMEISTDDFYSMPLPAKLIDGKWEKVDECPAVEYPQAEPMETPGENDSSGDVVTWDELDAAYNEGVNGAYE